MTSPNVYEGYMGAGTAQILTALFQNIGAPGITPLSLGVFTFDFGLVFYALAFTYEGLFKEKRNLVNYFLPALFISAAYFTHNVNILLVFFFSILLFLFFLAKSRKYIVKLGLLTVAFMICLDAISKWLLTNTLLGIAATLDLQLLVNSVNTTTLILVSSITLFVSLAVVIFYRKKQQLTCHLTLIHSKIMEALDRSSVRIIFFIFGFSVFLISVILFFFNFGNIQYTGIWVNSGYTFPWYYIVFRSFGIVLPFALASLPFLFMVRKRTLVLIFGFLLSILIPIVLSLVFPTFLSPSIIYTRYSAYLFNPSFYLCGFSTGPTARLKKTNFENGCFIFISSFDILIFSFTSIRQRILLYYWAI